MPELLQQSLESHGGTRIMLLDDLGKHKVLGRWYSDDQLFRIIVPKRFTLHAYPPGSEVKAGFSRNAITTSGDIRSEFSDEDIALVLQYRWPEDFGDLKACDIDAVNNSVKGVGNNLESEADILNYDDVTLSDYFREKLYNDKVRREQILDDFQTELDNARKIRAEAVEERFKRTDPGVLQYIIVARIHHALSWNSIAFSLNRQYARPEGHRGLLNRFDAGLVEEIFQLHAEAKTTIYEKCFRRDWKMLSTVPTETDRREAQSQSNFSPVTPAAMTLAESERESMESRPW